jgi:hypothetical protein
VAPIVLSFFLNTTYAIRAGGYTISAPRTLHARLSRNSIRAQSCPSHAISGSTHPFLTFPKSFRRPHHFSPPLHTDHPLTHRPTSPAPLPNQGIGNRRSNDGTQIYFLKSILYLPSSHVASAPLAPCPHIHSHATLPIPTYYTSVELKPQPRRLTPINWRPSVLRRLTNHLPHAPLPSQTGIHLVVALVSFRTI